METLEEAIQWLDPHNAVLKDCLGIGDFAEIVLISDGRFLGRLEGDLHFHYVLTASDEAKSHNRELFDQLSPEHQVELLSKLRSRGIPPESIGIPESAN